MLAMMDIGSVGLTPGSLDGMFLHTTMVRLAIPITLPVPVPSGNQTW